MALRSRGRVQGGGDSMRAWIEWADRVRAYTAHEISPADIDFAEPDFPRAPCPPHWSVDECPREDVKRTSLAYTKGVGRAKVPTFTPREYLIARSEAMFARRWG